MSPMHATCPANLIFLGPAINFLFMSESSYKNSAFHKLTHVLRLKSCKWLHNIYRKLYRWKQISKGFSQQDVTLTLLDYEMNQMRSHPVCNFYRNRTSCKKQLRIKQLTYIYIYIYQETNQGMKCSEKGHVIFIFINEALTHYVKAVTTVTDPEFPQFPLAYFSFHATCRIYHVC